MILNPAQTSYLDFLIQLRQSHWDDVSKYRDYADGEQTAQLTAKQKEIITGSATKDPEFVLNVCAPVLNVEVDRLKVKALDVVIPTDDTLTGETADARQEMSDSFSKRAWRWWKRSRMDEGQIHAAFSAARDGDSYLVVDYQFDYDRGVPIGPRISINEAMDGDRNGVEIVYEDDSPNKPLYAIKQWTVHRPITGNVTIGKKRRRNIYYRNRVEKYINESGTGVFTDANWLPFEDQDGVTELTTIEDEDGSVRTNVAVAWCTDTGTPEGRPLGLPVFHLRSNARGGAYGRSSIADIVPGLQDAINLSSVSLLAAAQMAGFKVPVITGVKEAVGKTLKLFPGMMIGIEDPEASVSQLTESDLRQLIEVVNSYIIHAATITNTPLSFFNITGQVAAEGTLKQQEAALLAKVKRNQTAYGNAYEDALRMMFRLEAVYGAQALGIAIDDIDNLEISCEWEAAETRNDREVLELTILRHKELGTPRNVAWGEAGYSQDQIAQMETDTDTKRNVVMGEIAATIAAAESGNEVDAETTLSVSDSQVVPTGRVAGEQLPTNIESDKGLNGAQITAAIDVLAQLQQGTMSKLVAVELLVALGIDQARAQRMVNDMDSVKAPPIVEVAAAA